MAAPLVIVPIFPLPDVTFFPHTLMPLHVFEARYRVLVIDALERDRRLAVMRLQPGYEATYAGKPPVHAVGGLGEIVSCERLATGRYNILLRGECRVRLEQELPTDTLYRVVRARRLADAEPAGDATPALARIRASCRELLGALSRPADLLDTALAEGQAAGVIADRVAAAVLPEADLRQRLLETLDVDARVASVADALEALVRELKGGRE
jgi:Lon protease-like protein